MRTIDTTNWGLERARIPATLNQTEEVHRHIERLYELFLRHPPLRPNLPQSLSELLPESSHLEEVSKRSRRVRAARYRAAFRLYPGHIREPYPWLARPSRTEGFLLSVRLNCPAQ